MTSGESLIKSHQFSVVLFGSCPLVLDATANERHPTHRRHLKVPPIWSPPHKIQCRTCLFLKRETNYISFSFLMPTLGIEALPSFTINLHTTYRDILFYGQHDRQEFEFEVVPPFLYPGTAHWNVAVHLL